MDKSSDVVQVGAASGAEGRGGTVENFGAKRRGRLIRWLSVLFILAALLTIVRMLPIDRAMAAMNGWIAALGIWGPVVLALAYVVATVLFVPGTILTLTAGALFGLAVGTIAVSIGSTLGASLAFLLARYAARDKIAAIAAGDGRFAAIDRAIGQGSWKIVALLRLSPAIPFNVQNYLYGLTPIRFWPYVVASWLAMLPGTFLYVYLGHAVGAAAETGRGRSPAQWALLGVGLLATAVVTIYITRLARRKLDEQMTQTTSENPGVARATCQEDPVRRQPSGPQTRPAFLCPDQQRSVSGFTESQPGVR